jgi:hypothetical protein
MFVTNDVSLRGQLREFVDHSVMKLGKRRSDGQESISIPLESSVLAEFLAEQEREGED